MPLGEESFARIIQAAADGIMCIESMRGCVSVVWECTFEQYREPYDEDLVFSIAPLLEELKYLGARAA